MKFVVSSNTLLTRLQAVSKVIGGKPVQPILDNILLVATDGMQLLLIRKQQWRQKLSWSVWRRREK